MAKTSNSKKTGKTNTNRVKPGFKKRPKADAKAPEAKAVNPFGEKKRTPGKSSGPKGKRNFKRREDENLEIKLSDKDAATVATIRRKLVEIREYKKILAEDGQKPDQQDKERESQLIVRLLRMEKTAKMEARQRAKAAKTELYREMAEKEAFAKLKRRSKSQQRSDADEDEMPRDYEDEVESKPRKRR